MPYTQQGFGEYTDMMFEEICFSTPRSAESAEDIAAAVAKAVEMDGRKAFAEGLAERLTQLGTPCTAEDTETMLAEVRRRYKALLGGFIEYQIYERCSFQVAFCSLFLNLFPFLRRVDDFFAAERFIFSSYKYQVLSFYHSTF